MKLILLSLAAFCITGCATRHSGTVTATKRSAARVAERVMVVHASAKKLHESVPEAIKPQVEQLSRELDAVTEAATELTAEVAMLEKDIAETERERDVAVGEQRKAEETRDRWRTRANKLMAIASVAAGAVSWSVLRILPLPWRLAGCAAVGLVSYLMLYSFL